jgi:hypothetical protein
MPEFVWRDEKAREVVAGLPVSGPRFEPRSPDYEAGVIIRPIMLVIFRPFNEMGTLSLNSEYVRIFGRRSAILEFEWRC